MELNQKFTTIDYDKHVGHTRDVELQDVQSYQKLIGKLLYLTITRLNLCFLVQILSQFMNHPKQSHWDAIMRVVRYVKSARGLGILLHKSPIDHLSIFCNFDWAGCPNTRRSVTSYFVKLGGFFALMKIKEKPKVSRSSVEAKYRSLAAAAAEIIQVLGLLKELQISIHVPVTLYCDSKAALQIAANPIFYEWTKHIKIDCHFVREKIKACLISPQHISTNLQLANLMTKGLSSAHRHFLLSKLEVLDIFHPPT